MPTMADPLGQLWQQQENLAAIEVKPSAGDVRACGCHWDVLVFGHERYGVPGHDEAAA